MEQVCGFSLNFGVASFAFGSFGRATLAAFRSARSARDLLVEVEVVDFGLGFGGWAKLAGDAGLELRIAAEDRAEVERADAWKALR